MKNKKWWWYTLSIATIPAITAGTILAESINISSIANTNIINSLNNEMNRKVANDELIKSSTTHNNNNVISLADTKYNQFQNSIVNLAPWKRLVGKNKILCFPEEVVHTKSGQIDLMYTNINADHSISEPKIVKINFNDSTNYTDIYYSGGCYSEAIDKFIIVISIKSIYNDWFPVFITIDDNNEAELNSSQLFVDIKSEENHKNKSLMVSNLSGSLINKQYPMAILSKDITSAIGSYNAPNFRVVEFQKPDSLIADPTFLIYLYAPGVYNKLNFLATDTGAITNGWGQHVFQTCVSISSSNQVTWKPNLLKNDTRYYNFLKAENWDNPIINITPFFTNDINRPQFIGMYQESIQTFNNGKRRQTFVETYDMANKTPFTNPSDFINVKREIACNDMNGQRINNLATSKVVTWLSNSSIDYNTTKVLMYNAANKMDLIFVSDSNKGSYDGGFIATQYFTSNSSEQNLIDDSINWMWNIAYGVKDYHANSYSYNLSPSELLSFYFNQTTNKFLDMDIKSYYFDIKNKKMMFLINYLKWNNGNATSNTLNSSKPIFVTLDFAKYSSANSTFFNYQFPTNNASFTNKINNGDFLDYLINRNNTVASSFNMLPSTAYREYTEGSFHLKSFPIMVSTGNGNYVYTKPSTKQAYSSNFYFDQKETDLISGGNFGSISKNNYITDITKQQLLEAVKTDLSENNRFLSIGNLYASPINQNPLGALEKANQDKIYSDRVLLVWKFSIKDVELVDTDPIGQKNALINGILRFKIKLSYNFENGLTNLDENNPMAIANEYNDKIFTITGLKKLENIVPTTLKIDTINWDSELYRNIFTGASKGFNVDFNSNLNARKTEIETYIKNHLSDFLEYSNQKVPPSLNNDFTININGDNTKATVNFTYCGVNENHQYVNNIPGSITINLRSLNSQDFSGFNQFLQNKINNDNNGLWPNEAILKDWTAQFLNQSNINAIIPNVVGRIDASKIVIDTSKLHKDTSPITFDEGAFKTNTTPSIIIPSGNIIVKNTIHVESIAATSPINAYMGAEILGIWNSNHNDKTIQTLKNWIEANKATIFKNTQPSNATIVSIDNITRGNNDSSLNITITLSQAYTINNGLVSNKQFTFTITNFRDGEIVPTTQKLTTINYTDTIFKNIFGSNNKGFTIDFKNSLNENSSKLETYIKANIDTIFNTNGLSTIGLTSKVTLSQPINNVVTATFQYSGYNSNKIFVNDNHGSITINLRPDPSANDFSGFKQFLQNKINNNNSGLWPDDNLLKDWVVEYLNKPEIKNNLPDAVGTINSNNIVLDSSKIHKNKSPVSLDEGVIRTNTTPIIIFPTMSVDVKNTVVIDSIQATSPINTYMASEILGIWNSNHNDKTIQTLKSWIETNKTTIFNNTQPSDATVASIDNITNGNQDNSLRVTITLSKAYTIDHNVVNNKQFTFTITNFRGGEIVPTTQKLTTIKYTDAIFKTIFGNHNKGFTVDFANSLEQNAILLENYINTNINEVFNTNGLNTISLTSKITLNQPVNNVVIATFNYSGYNANKEFVNNNRGTITINLKPNPTANDFAGFNEFLQNKINNENQGLMPNDNLLKDWVSDYLNSPSIKNNLPDAVGTINANKITLDTSKIHKDTSPIIFDENAIKTNTNPMLSFPALSVIVKNTVSIPSIAATHPINTYKATEVLGIWSGHPTNDIIKTLQTWIETNKEIIFNNTQPNDTTVVSIDNITKGSQDSSLRVTITLSKAYTIDQGIANNQQFSFEITGFKTGSLIETKQTLTEIKYSEEIFKSIFGNDNKGFGIDFEKNLIQNGINLKNYINDHVLDFFQTESVINTKITTDISISQPINNIVIATFNFSGFNSDGILVNNLPGKITITLRSTPGTDTSPEANNPLANLNEFLQTKVNQNGNILPDTNTLKEWVAEYLNQDEVKNNLPNSCIPGGANGSFNANNIRINKEKIKHDSSPIIFEPGAISTSVNGNTLTFPEMTINVKVTSAKDVEASSPIKNYYASEILLKWENNKKEDSKIVAIKNWINDNKTKIFTDLPTDATVALTNIKSVVGDNNALNITVRVSKAYDPSGKDFSVIENKEFSFKITRFKPAPTKPTTLIKTKISYTDTIFSKIFVDCQNGYTVDFKNDINNEQKQLMTYINQNINIFFEKADDVDINVNNVKIVVNPNDNSATATITYSGFDANGKYNENNQGTITIALRPTPGIDTSPEANNPLAGINQFLNNKVRENNGIFPNIETLKQWISEFLNQPSVKDNLPKDCLPSSNNFKPSNIHIDVSKIDKTKNPIVIAPGAITTTNVNTSLTLPEANISIIITELKNNGAIDATDSSISSLTPEQIYKDQNNINSLTMKKINEFLNEKKDMIFSGLPTDATISVVPGTVIINPDKSVSLKIKVSIINTLEGPERDKTFNVQISGISKEWTADTTLKFKEFKSTDLLFSNIFNNNSNSYDKGYAVDWACLTLEQITEKENEFTQYVNNNIDVFFNNAIHSFLRITNTTTISNVKFNFDEIGTNNIVVINFNFNGYQNNAINPQLSGSINLKLQSFESANGNMENIFGIDGPVQEAIQNWVDNHPGKIPTPEELTNIVNEVLNKPINPDIPNGTKYGDLLPDVYKPANIIIDSHKINIDGDKLTINKGAIQFKPKQENIDSQGNWGSIQNIVVNRFEPFTPAKQVVIKQANTDWWIWVVIVCAVGVIILISVAVIINIINSRKKETF